ncbi:MAG: sugar phosphate isomerase/epimerase [Tissierellia bacterium]|nr:sugar phosphate isomerase/epimerase [Tissierellia bacterium]
MIFGMPALVEFNTLNELIDLCLKLNLNFIELNMNMPYNFIEKLNPLELKNITKETNIQFTMHMPDEADLGSFYESVRKGYVQLFLDTIDWAKEAGVKLLNIHIIEGAKMTLPHKKVYIYDQYSEDFSNNFIKSIKTLSKKAKENDLIIAIENSSNFGKPFIQKTLDQALSYSNIKLSWDTGHDAVSNFTDKIYLMKNQNHIAHMHLHDARGKSDHQVLFEGDLKIEELLNFANERNITVLVEVKTAQALIKSIENLKTKILR